VNKEGTRLVIVQRGEAALFRELRQRFADDPKTRVIWERRTTDRRGAPAKRTADRRRGDRRRPEDPSVFAGRGYFVSRSARS
jgi:hypothetical protein